MDIYAPQTQIKSPWKEISLVVIGFWIAGLGALSVWANYLFYTSRDVIDEWTAEERKTSLETLVQKAKAEGVVEPTAEEKMRALQGFGR